jgi:hypothetical protein
VDLPIIDLFTYRTAATMAARVEDRLVAELPALTAGEIEAQLDVT